MRMDCEWKQGKDAAEAKQPQIDCKCHSARSSSPRTPPQLEHLPPPACLGRPDTTAAHTRSQSRIRAPSRPAGTPPPPLVSQSKPTGAIFATHRECHSAPRRCGDMRTVSLAAARARAEYDRCSLLQSADMSSGVFAAHCGRARPPSCVLGRRAAPGADSARARGTLSTTAAATPVFWRRASHHGPAASSPHTETSRCGIQRRNSRAFATYKNLKEISG
ncbi:hypothetical protein C8J57DRAFT_1592266 [Mycena rebaudengoi]|nr:hypothetical protein C8J57DRAFT_1592266 [Mycena rebaudengoi]